MTKRKRTKVKTAIYKTYI